MPSTQVGRSGGSCVEISVYLRIMARAPVGFRLMSTIVQVTGRMASVVGPIPAEPAGRSGRPVARHARGRGRRFTGRTLARMFHFAHLWALLASPGPQLRRVFRHEECK